MKAIELLKEQISAEFVFTSATNLEELRELWLTTGARISHGVARMRESCLFTREEIEDVRIFAVKLRNSRHDECYRKIREKMREEFEF